MPELEREYVAATMAAEAKMDDSIPLRLALEEFFSKADPLVAELYIRLLLANGRRADVCEFLTLNSEYRAAVLFEVSLLKA